MSLSLENIGMIPTEKLYVKISYFDSLTKEELWKLGKTNDQSYPLIPGKKLPFTFQIKAEDYFKLDEKNYHYGIRVGYYINNDESHTIGKIWRIERTGVDTKEYWIDEPEK